MKKKKKLRTLCEEQDHRDNYSSDVVSCGNNFGRLVKNMTIEKCTAHMWYPASSNFGRLVRNRTIEKFTSLMWYLGAHTSDTFEKINHVLWGIWPSRNLQLWCGILEQILRNCLKRKTMEKIYLEGRNFGRLVKNRIIEKFTALIWYLAGSHFGRFVRKRTIVLLLGKKVTSPAIIQDILRVATSDVLWGTGLSILFLAKR